ncbi:Tubulin--tyrosine ligase-like protein 12 [Sparganum proliferum]
MLALHHYHFHERDSVRNLYKHQHLRCPPCAPQKGGRRDGDLCCIYRTLYSSASPEPGVITKSRRPVRRFGFWRVPSRFKMTSYTFNEFVNDHKNQLLQAGIPDRYWQALHAKLLAKLANMRPMLLSNPSLVGRLLNILSVTEDGLSMEEQIAHILRNIWKYVNLYQLSTMSNPDSHPILREDFWYVLDEVGSSIQHSDKPNVRIAPILYTQDGLCYSVFWPITDLKRGDSVTVDKVAHVADADRRPYLLLPWVEQDFSDLSSAHDFVFSDAFFASHRSVETQPLEVDCDLRSHATSGCILKVYTDLPLIHENLTNQPFALTDKVDEADIVWLNQHYHDFRQLSTETPSRFVNQFPSEAVLTVKDLLAALSASPKAIDIAGSSGDVDVDGKTALSCAWYPLTFNLVYELAQFVAFFQRQELADDESSQQADVHFCANSSQCWRICGPDFKVGDDPLGHAPIPEGNKNVWIVKPWNLGRGLGIFITDNLSQILRLVDSVPQIASRYLTDPVLFYRDDIKNWVKFDVRYVVLLRSIQPLELFAHKVFWLRFANKPFSLGDYDDYPKHFTVMNYREEDELKQVHHTDFISQFERQYPNIRWKAVEAKIHQVLVEMFKVASSEPPPRGLGACKQSRAMYAVDLLLEWKRCGPSSSSSSSCFTIQPQVCEVNFSPDCTRACKFYPHFYNEVFDCLFLEKEVDSIQRLI